MVFSISRTQHSARMRGAASLALLAAALALSACGRNDRIPTPTTDSPPNQDADSRSATSPAGGMVGGLDESTSATAGVSPSGSPGGTFGINASGTESMDSVLPEPMNIEGSSNAVTGTASAALPVTQGASGADGN
jgi:hypothetical protein